ncbi:MAG TPA: DNA-processing protein DprA, partial [Solirubrobacteraceae bacterium]|nr:DNA-processing protein DprA [Solirubrobacteraceae bacterium]
GMGDGVAAAAHAGALEAGGGAIAVLAGGLWVGCAARWRALYEQIVERGCAVSELPRECEGRRWGALASERIVVGLAEVTVVVEAEDTRADVFAAEIARAHGRVLAAVPGRVTSPLSRGSHALLADGARLVRDAADVLELLGAPTDRSAHGGGCALGEPPDHPAHDGSCSLGAAPDRPAHDDGCALGEPPAGLERRLRATLARVGAGWDTPERLMRCGEPRAATLLALSELEVRGLLVRGEGGRYLPREPLRGTLGRDEPAAEV